jgi:hypothetical protein
MATPQGASHLKLIVNIDVPEIAPAVEFYTRALGLENTRTLDGDTAELTGASSVIYLLLRDAGSRAVRNPAVDRCYARHWTPVHFDLVVPDVDAAAARAIAAGAKQETGYLDWRGSRLVA